MNDPVLTVGTDSLAVLLQGYDRRAAHEVVARLDPPIKLSRRQGDKTTERTAEDRRAAHSAIEELEG